MESAQITSGKERLDHIRFALGHGSLKRETDIKGKEAQILHERDCSGYARGALQACDRSLVTRRQLRRAFLQIDG